jgi:diadenosine tetraphosphate (Ap4A) HIT family hydrolase
MKTEKTKEKSAVGSSPGVKNNLKKQTVSPAPKAAEAKHSGQKADMFITPDNAKSHPVEIGPAPYHRRSDCFICRIQDGLEIQPAGGFIIQGKHFVVTHAPLKMAKAGTFIILSRRHLLDFGEMTQDESTEFGSIMTRLVPAIKDVTEAHRVYYLALMEHSPHFHLWLVSNKKSGRLRGVPYLAHPTGPASHRAAEAISKKVEMRFEQSH